MNESKSSKKVNNILNILTFEKHFLTSTPPKSKIWNLC